MEGVRQGKRQRGKGVRKGEKGRWGEEMGSWRKIGR